MTTAHHDYITVRLLSSGYAAVHMRYYDDMEGYDVQQTGIGRFVHKKGAIIEATTWAASLGVELRL